MIQCGTEKSSFEKGVKIMFKCGPAAQKRFIARLHAEQAKADIIRIKALKAKVEEYRETAPEYAEFWQETLDSVQKGEGNDTNA